MGKFTTYFLLAGLVMIMFHLGGVLGNTNSFLGILLDPSSFNLTNPFNIIVATLSGVGLAAGVIIGFVTKDIRSAVMVPVTIFFLALFWDFLIVYNIIAGVNKPLALLFIGPVLFIFSLISIDFWRGTD